MAQNQKLRRSVSAGESSTSFQVPYMESYLRTCSRRSNSPATQPRPPSLRAIFMLGKRTGILE